MEQPFSSGRNESSNKALNIAYIALFISLVSICTTGWFLYQGMNQSKSNMETDKVDEFFKQQDQEFEKIFKEEK